MLRTLNDNSSSEKYVVQRGSGLCTRHRRNLQKKRDAREDLGNPTRVANGEMPHKQNMVYGKEKKKEIETVKQGSSNQRLRSRLMASGANSADVAEE